MTDMVNCQSVYNDHSDTHIGGGMFTDLTVSSKLIKGYKRDSISCEFVGYWEEMKIICLVKEQDIKTRHAIKIPS